MSKSKNIVWTLLLFALVWVLSLMIDGGTSLIPANPFETFFDGLGDFFINTMNGKVS